MNELTSEPVIRDQEAKSTPIAAKYLLVWAAWIATLLLSDLPLILAREFLATDIPWITPAWVGIAILLIAATYVWPSFKPLRKYFVIMGLIRLIPRLYPLVSQLPLVRGWMESETVIVRLFADRVLLVFGTLLVLSALYLMGVKRREAFLTAGSLNAPVGGEANPDTTPARKRRLTWAVLGPAVALGLAILFYLFLVSQNPAGWSNLSAVLPWLPLILVTAAMNAFGEEAQFRAAPIATLLPAVSPRQALWMTSLWFGLGHYYTGFPSGPFGLVQTGLLALLMGKAMLDTRGLGWSWIIHMAIDTVIYIFIVSTAI